jgi:hypothetical protein
MAAGRENETGGLRSGNLPADNESIGGRFRMFVREHDILF